jgi:hypothetical protein
MSIDDNFADTMPDIFGSTIFCDDIRFENTNKLIAIGIYNSGVQIGGSFPFQMKSFAMLINYSERIGTQTEQVKIQVFFPSIADPLIEVQLPSEQFRLMAEPNKDPNAFKANFHTAVLPIVMGPVMLAEKGVIKVIARIGDRVQRLGVLRIDAVSLPVSTSEAAQTKKEEATS